MEEKPVQFLKAMTAFPEDVESDDVAEGYPPFPPLSGGFGALQAAIDSRGLEDRLPGL